MMVVVAEGNSLDEMWAIDSKMAVDLANDLSVVQKHGNG